MFKEKNIETFAENLFRPAVEGLVDFMMQSEEAFEYSKKGYKTRVSYMIDTGNAKSEEEVVAEDGDDSIYALLDRIKRLDNDSIIAACKAVSYDIWYASAMIAKASLPADQVLPDEDTIKRIKEAVLDKLKTYIVEVSNFQAIDS